MRYRLASFQLDTDRRVLTHAGEPVTLQAKAFDLLAYLVENRDRTVPKQEILAAVWPGTRVTESSLTRAMNLLRSALEDAAPEANVVRTVRGVGYALEAPVRTEVEIGADPAGAAALPLVGRETELARLDALVAEVASGVSSSLLVAGDAGIGKTRLLEELVERARVAGFDACWGRAFEGEGGSAYWPIVQILRSLLAGRPAGFLERVLGAGTPESELRAALREWVPELDAHGEGTRREDAAEANGAPTTASARLRLFEQVANLLRELASSRPLLVVLDDLQWADPASLSLLSLIHISEPTRPY